MSGLGLNRRDLMHALATLCDEHGAEVVVNALADAAASCADVSTDKDQRFMKAAESLRLVAHQVRDGQVTLSMGCEVLADLPLAGEEIAKDETAEREAAESDREHAKRELARRDAEKKETWR